MTVAGGEFDNDENVDEKDNADDHGNDEEGNDYNFNEGAYLLRQQDLQLLAGSLTGDTRRSPNAEPQLCNCN